VIFYFEKKKLKTLTNFLI